MSAEEQRVGEYVLVREVAPEGEPVVHEARSPEGVRVALEVVGEVAPAAWARFEAERPLLEELTADRGFVALLDAGREAGRAWLVSERVEGGERLRERLARGAMSVDEAVDLGVRLGSALGRAHARGIAHGGLTPRSIVFAPGGGARPRIAGLARARLVGGDAPCVSVSRGVVALGTACYRAPEQIAGEASAPGPAGDVFALGQLVYECLAGAPPSLARSADEALERVRSGQLSPLRERVPAAPAWLEAALARALERSPGRRWPDGEAFASALSSAGDAGAGGEASAVGRARSPTRRVVAVGGAVLVAIAALAVGAWTRSRSPGRDDDVSTGVLRDARPSRADARPPAADAAQVGSVSVIDSRLAALLDEARAHANAGQLGRAVELAEEVLAAAPDEPVALAIVGSCVAGREAELDRAIALRAAGWMHGNRATFRSRRDDWRGARADLDRALELDGPSARWLALRGEARQRLGDLAGALEDAAAAIRLDERSAPAWRALALVRRRQGERDNALAAMRKAVALQPSHAAATEELAGMLVERGEHGDALRLLDALLARDPDRPLARGARGTALLLLERHVEAARDLARATELDPDEPLWWANLGTARMRVGAWAQGLAAAERALALEPEFVIGLRTRGLCREALGEPAGALDDLERALALEPRRAQSDRGLIEALARLRAR